MVMGITIGVAVAVAIDLANASSAKALELSTQSLVGKATHQVFAPPAGLDEAVFADIVKSGLPLKAAPIVSGILTSPQMGNLPMQLMGIDPFYDYAFRSYLGQTNQFFDVNAFQLFTHPGAIIISSSIAIQYHLKPGDTLSIDYGGETKKAYVAGVVSSNDSYQNRIFQGLIISDISTAQEILQKEGTIDRIDLILPPDNQAIEEQLSLLLPGSVKVTPIEARSAGLDQLTSAFQTNLTALSFLAMLVGMFLIYNTMTFGIYRCLGVTRREIFLMVMAEAAVIGIVGGLLGLIAGIGLGQFTIKMVSQTVNDLYFTTTINSTSISYSSLVKGFLLGLITTIITAIPPALEAASVSPREALSRYSVEHRSKQRLWKVALAGVVALGIAFILLNFPTKSLIVGFSIIAFITVGFAMITPLVMVWLLNFIQPILKIMSRLSGRLAPRNLISSLSRTSVAVSALMVSIAVSIGVGLMIGSFRTTVDEWLLTSLQGDVYITAPSFISNQPTLPIDQAILPDLKTNPEIASFYQLKINTVESEKGEIQIAATDNKQLPYERLYKKVDLPKSDIWQAMENGSILVTESLAYHLGIPDSGGSIRLATSQGLVSFPIIGVYYDYASTSGTVQMPLDVYQRYWGDKTISAIGIHLKPGINADNFSKNLPGILPTNQSLLIRPNKDLRQDVMVVFDRTFAITRALQILAMVVAFIGILSALGLLQFERQREMGIMRALGLTNREVWSLAMLETFLMGLVAGLMAIPTGYTLALVLVDIINQRSFGWSMRLSASPVIFLQAIGIAIAAAVLAGIFPAWRMSHMQAVEAIRYE
jgi:putative ABC transport system permease protein